MSLSIEELESLSIGVLRSKSAEMGLPTPNTLKKAELIQNILSVQVQMKPKDKPQPEVVEVKSDTGDRTDFDELEKALQPFIDKGLVLRKEEDDTFYMKFKKKEDSGTLKQRMKVIVMKASVLCR